MVYVQNGMMKLTSYWRVAEYATLKYATLVYWFLSCRHLENNQSMERLPPNSFHLSKDVSSRRNSTAEFLPPCPRNFINQIRLTHRREDKKLTPHPDKLCHKLSYLPSILLKAHSFFLKIISLLWETYNPSPLSL